MNFWILSSRLARARRDLADIDDKNQKFKEILSKKCLSKSENPKNSWFSSKIFSLLFYKFWCFSMRNCNIKSNSQRNRRENPKIRRYSREQADLNFTIFRQISAKFHHFFEESKLQLVEPRRERGASPRARPRGAGERREQSEQSKNSLYLFNEKKESSRCKSVFSEKKECSQRKKECSQRKKESSRCFLFFLFFLLFSFSFLLESRKSELRRGGGGNFRGLFLGYIEIKFCK